MTEEIKSNRYAWPHIHIQFTNAVIKKNMTPKSPQPGECVHDRYPLAMTSDPLGSNSRRSVASIRVAWMISSLRHVSHDSCHSRHVLSQPRNSIDCRAIHFSPRHSQSRLLLFCCCCCYLWSLMEISEELVGIMMMSSLLFASICKCRKRGAHCYCISILQKS